MQTKSKLLFTKYDFHGTLSDKVEQFFSDFTLKRVRTKVFSEKYSFSLKIIYFVITILYLKK